MELAVDGLAILIHKLERVAAVAVHVAYPVRRAAIREQEGDLVSRLRPQRDEVPEHVRVLEVGHRVTLLGVDEARELGEENTSENSMIVTTATQQIMNKSKFNKRAL